MKGSTITYRIKQRGYSPQKELDRKGGDRVQDDKRVTGSGFRDEYGAEIALPLVYPL
jgi:hypothetical protein